MQKSNVQSADTPTSPFRPFAKLGLLFCSALFVAARRPLPLTLCLFAVFLFAGVVMLVLSKKLPLKRAAIGLLLIAFAFGYFSLYTILCYLPSQAYNGTISQIEGEITDIEVLDDGAFRYTIRVEQIQDHSFSIPFSAYLYVQDQLVADYGDEISSTVTLSSTSLDETFFLKEHSRSKGIFLKGTLTESVVITPRSRPCLSSVCLHIRDRLTENLRLYTHTPNSELACGIIFGIKSGIPSDITDDFIMAGFSHLLTVSGLHMTMLAGFVSALLALLKIPSKTVGILSLSILVVFSVMVGFSPSVIRSLIMTGTGLFAFLLSRDFDGLNALGLSALILLLFSPYSIMDVSFLLSFSATLGILILAPRIQQTCEELFQKYKLSSFQSAVIESFSASLAALVFTFPICLVAFQTLSIIAPVSNIIAAPLSGLILLFGLFTATLGLFCPPLASLPGFLTDLCTDWLIRIANFFANLPFATFPTDYSWMTFCLLLSLIVSMVCYFSKRRTVMLKTGALLCCLIFLTGAFSYRLLNRDVVSLAVLGNDTGYSIVVSYGTSAIVLGCGGDSYAGENTYGYLKGRGIQTVDLLILPELTNEYSSGAPFLVSHCDVANIVTPFEGRNYEQLALAAQKGGPNLFELSTMTLDLAPIHLLVDARYTSPVILLTVDEWSIGFSQDAEAIQEARPSYKMNVILTNDKIDDAQLYNSGAYVILLNDQTINDQTNIPTDCLQIPSDASLRLNWNDKGLTVEDVQ